MVAVPCVRDLELITRRLVTGSLHGDYTSARIGGGFEFHQVRDYAPGDDIRTVDWKSSARANKLLVREYVEEKNKTVVIAVDLSSSMWFGSGKELKITTAQKVSALLAFAAGYHHDMVALVGFAGNEIVFSTPYLRRMQGIRKELETFFAQQEKVSSRLLTTTFEALFAFVADRYGKASLLCLISDFIIHDADQKALRQASMHYDIVSLKIQDPIEHVFPHVGVISLLDSEQNDIFLDISSKFCDIVRNECAAFERHQNSFFVSCHSDMYTIQTGCQTWAGLIRFFQRRRVRARR